MVSDDEGPDDDNLDYEGLLKELVEHWLSLEMRHRVSKSASEDFWDLSKKFFPKLHKARIEDMVYKPIPKLRSQRNKINAEKVPPIHMAIGYLNKETDEMTVVKGSKNPKSNFDPRTFEKKFEIASVKVINTY